jgi:hypothetical protein
MQYETVNVMFKILAEALSNGWLVWVEDTLHISAQMWSTTNCTCEMFNQAIEVELATGVFLQLTRAKEVVYHVGSETSEILKVIDLPPTPEGTHPTNTYTLGDDCKTCLIIRGLPMSWTRDPMPNKDSVTQP